MRQNSREQLSTLSLPFPHPHLTPSSLAEPSKGFQFTLYYTSQRLMTIPWAGETMLTRDVSLWKTEESSSCSSSFSPHHEERHEFCHNPCLLQAQRLQDQLARDCISETVSWNEPFLFLSYLKYLVQQQNTNAQTFRKHIKSRHITHTSVLW